MYSKLKTAQTSLMPKKYLVAILWGGGGRTLFKNMVVIKTASYVTKQLTPATKC